MIIILILDTETLKICEIKNRLQSFERGKDLKSSKNVSHNSLTNTITLIMSAPNPIATSKFRVV